MGNRSSTKMTKGREEPVPTVDALPEAIITKPLSLKLKTETELDSMIISVLVLPGLGEQRNVSFGLVNTVEEEIECLIHKYALNISCDQCKMLIVRQDGGQTVMHPEHNIEEYMDELSMSTVTVQLVHNPSSESMVGPNLGSLGIDLKST